MLRPTTPQDLMTGPSLADEFATPREYEKALDGAGMGRPTLFLTDRLGFRLRFVAAKLNSAVVVGGRSTVPVIVRLAEVPLPTITFRASAWESEPPLRSVSPPGAVTLRVPGMEQFIGASAEGDWATIMVSPALLQHSAMRLMKRRLDLSPALPRVLKPDNESFRLLAEQHSSVIERVSQSPESLGRPELRDEIAEKIADLCVHCIQNDRADHDNAVATRHTQLLLRLRALVEERPEEPLQVSDFCTSLNVSSRTLHAVCQQHFGMGPKRYLTMRRLEMARQALLAGSADEVNVTAIALRCGFWELGRFAGAYKLAFGESPSETLRRVD